MKTIRCSADACEFVFTKSPNIVDMQKIENQQLHIWTQMTLQLRERNKKVSECPPLICLVILRQQPYIFVWNKYTGVMRIECNEHILNSSWFQYDPILSKVFSLHCPPGLDLTWTEEHGIEIVGQALCLSEMALSQFGLWNDILGFIHYESVSTGNEAGILSNVTFKARLIPEFLKDPKKFLGNRNVRVPCVETVWLATEISEGDNTFCFSQDLDIAVGKMRQSGFFYIRNGIKCSFMNERIQQYTEASAHNPCCVVTIDETMVVAVDNRDSKWECASADLMVVYKQKPSKILLLWNKDMGIVTASPGITAKKLSIGDRCRGKFMLYKNEEAPPVSALFSMSKQPKNKSKPSIALGIMLGTSVESLSRFVYSTELGMVKIPQSQLRDYCHIPPLTVVEFRAKLCDLEAKPSITMVLNHRGYLQTPWLLTYASISHLELNEFLENTNCIASKGGVVIDSTKRGKYKYVETPTGQMFRFCPAHCDLECFEKLNVGQQCVVLYNVGCLGCQTLFVQQV